MDCFAGHGGQFEPPNHQTTMSTYQSQEFLFRRIKELLPPDKSMVDFTAEILHISSDSAYRRIRGETPIVLDEARELCQYFKLSLDHVLNVKGGSTLFRDVRVNVRDYDYAQYLQDLLKQLKWVGSFIHKEIIYRTKDMPLFHNFYFEPVIAFRYFFWMHTIIEDPNFKTRGFDMNCVSPDIIELSRELNRAYNEIPSIEIWNTECVNAAISQIEFYKESGYFSSAADIRTIYEALEETFVHLKHQVDRGCKFMPDESPENRKNNFTFFYNRVVLGDNTILVVTDNAKTIFLNYDTLNYISTRDEEFCNRSYDDLQRLIKRSTIISETSERQRNIFFGIMLNRIKERKANL